MKLQSLTVRYNVKRTCEYQCAEVGAEMTLTVEEGDKICDLFRAGIKKLSPLVDEAADRQIKMLCDDARAMKGI